jgi:hypothetical protein
LLILTRIYNRIGYVRTRRSALVIAELGKECTGLQGYAGTQSVGEEIPERPVVHLRQSPYQPGASANPV